MLEVRGERRCETVIQKVGELEFKVRPVNSTLCFSLSMVSPIGPGMGVHGES